MLREVNKLIENYQINGKIGCHSDYNPVEMVLMFREPNIKISQRNAQNGANLRIKQLETNVIITDSHSIKSCGFKL